MNSQTHPLRLGALIALIMGLFFVPVRPVEANVLVFHIFQDGWETGGEVTGEFSGEDLNGNNVIELTNAEVYSYEIAFSGNSDVPMFAHDLDDLLFFDYTLGSGGFPPSFPLRSDNGEYFYDADDRVIGGVPGPGPFAVNANPAIVTQVIPEPATLLLFASGLTGAYLRRRQKRSA